MDSFYGGRQGASFIIKKRFDTLEDMKRAAGSVEEKVWQHGQYCLIDAINKNNPDNGKIYRRNTSIITNSGDNFIGAEYIGQVVGPSSGAPMFNFQPGLLTKEEIRNLGNGWDVLGYTADGASKGKLIFAENAKDFNDNLYTFEAKQGQGLVSGETNSSIKFNWINTRNETEESESGVIESWCNIGCEIPYPYFDTSVTRQPAGEQASVSVSTKENNPFYHTLNFKIPDGMHGVSVENVYISNGNVSAYDAETNLTYNTALGYYELTGSAKQYTGKNYYCDLRIFTPNQIREETFYIAPVMVHAPGVVYGPEPTNSSDAATIESIVNWYNNTYRDGKIENNIVSDKLHVVTPRGSKVSYFVVWNPEQDVWQNTCEVANGSDISFNQLTIPSSKITMPIPGNWSS